MKAHTILVFNSGSSSLKFSFFRMKSSLFDDFTEPELVTETLLNAAVKKETFQLDTLLEGEIEFSEQNKDKNNFFVKNANHQTLLATTISVANHTDAVLHIIRYIAGFNTPTPDAIAHRVVHGGPSLLQHCFIDDKVLRELALMNAFAPLHNQVALEIIQFTRDKFPKLPQIACFDTTFHSSMPDVAKQFPLNKALQEEGIHRYGFHGLSCESVVSQLSNATHLRSAKRLIIAHLGNGCSITAVKEGKSIDTSMGFTPSGGVMMGTRCGDIDPGILIYLMREKKYDCTALEALINQQSGLLGVSGLSGDMRILHDVATINANANLAIEMFCYLAAKQIGAMIAALNGIDTLVFTGGIGEHDIVVRQVICDQLDCFKIVLDDEKNQLAGVEHIHTISDTHSACAVRVVVSQENAQIAHHAALLLDVIPA